MYKSTGSTGAKTVIPSSVYTAYLQGVIELSEPDAEPRHRQRFRVGACNVKLAAGEAVGIQIRARHFQTTTPTWRVNVDGTNSEVRVVSDESSLS